MAKRPRQLGAGNASLYGATTLGTSNFKHATKRRSTRGFSLVELLVSLVILIILAAIAVPTLLRAYHSYQLGDVASRLSGTMKTTRFSAIRKNTAVGCQVQQNGSTWTVWTDLDGDGNPTPGEPQILISGTVQLLDAGSVPPPAAIVTAVGVGSPSLNTLSPGNASVWFDQRGARVFGTPPNFGGPATVDVLYLGNPSIPDLEFRAIVLLPAGTVQVWSATPGGPWQRIS
jgi:type IV fimbrial biogenesis protein FimT